jgi:hypothetical protein
VRVYVASSWKNLFQATVVEALRSAGHDVYDFRHPAEGDEGFHWTSVERAPRPWSAELLRDVLLRPIARQGFANDMGALVQCDACVLVLPCGRSAHLELGWAAGALKVTAVLMSQPDEPELMYAMLGRVCATVEEVIAYLAKPHP